MYDLVVIGGGITGAGIARDAALRGLQGRAVREGRLRVGHVVEVEQARSTAACATSSTARSALVFESVSERRVQTRVAPHLVRPLPFLIPIYKGVRPGLEIMNVGLWIYDSLALFRAPRLHKTFRGAQGRARARAAAARRRPARRARVLRLRDRRRAARARERARRARARRRLPHLHRGRCGSSAAATAGSPASPCAIGLTGDDVERAGARRRCSRPARGPTRWSRRFELPIERPLLRRTKGVHIVLPRERLPLARAITLISPVDGRVMFAIPWRERTVLGTTDTDFDGHRRRGRRRRRRRQVPVRQRQRLLPRREPDARRRDRDVGRPAPADRRADRGHASTRARCRASTRCSRATTAS